MPRIYVHRTEQKNYYIHTEKDKANIMQGEFIPEKAGDLLFGSLNLCLGESDSIDLRKVPVSK